LRIEVLYPEEDVS